MRTQLIGTGQMADRRNGRRASILPSIGDVTEFVSRMGRETAPMGYKAEEDKTRPDCYPVFLSRPSWITTGVFGLGKTADHAGVGRGWIDGTWIRTGIFEVAALTGTPTLIGKTSRYDAFLSRPSWITTGVFPFIGLGEESAPMGETDVTCGAFLSRPTWITTGVFGLSEPYGSPVSPILKVFDHTWITTGIFELTTPWGQADSLEVPKRLAA